MAEEVFSSPAYIKVRADHESSDFQKAYQIYTFATGRSITTCYLVFDGVTQECKLTWSATLLIITVGEQMGLYMCKYLISHIAVARMWKYPV